ncbi:MAG: TMEM165/GDT1 family protein [bacterium]
MLRTLLTVFTSVFIAELGDKTQLAVLLFSTDRDINKILVFISASLAMTIATLIGVIVGSKFGIFIPERILKIVAGIGFIGIGIWVLVGSR